MHGSLTHVGAAVTASFLASTVEFVEALTIVLAVGTVRGWKPALLGSFFGVLFLTVLVTLFGPALGRFPLPKLQLCIGVLLLLFGLRWLRKAVLRAAGLVGLHDEAAIYAKQTARLSGEKSRLRDRVDMVAVATTFKAVTLEGLEVVFIVIATGAAAGLLVPAACGAAAAGVMVIAAGVAVHKPLSRVPENTLKFAVGIILSSFGVFWIGEGRGFQWPGGDASLFALAGSLLCASFIGISLARHAAADRNSASASVTNEGGR
ncbi:MAG: TMEM165/GDT1 family protein [Armatimonadetes bacterium]|nr:TMEM165/GDT1 family protein [Armatimonadota bacterium]MDE2206921.1 TMEM165/GDT1 family protein [Armatimonadota bacterium]